MANRPLTNLLLDKKEESECSESKEGIQKQEESARSSLRLRMDGFSLKDQDHESSMSPSSGDGDTSPSKESLNSPGEIFNP